MINFVDKIMIERDKIMTLKSENLIEITWLIKEYITSEDIQMEMISYAELKEIINNLSDKFETLYCDADWNELNYCNEIEKFTNKEIALELWHRFGNVPLNPDTEEIEEEWNGFPAETFREDIWKWFERTFGVSVAKDLMGQGK